MSTLIAAQISLTWKQVCMFNIHQKLTFISQEAVLHSFDYILHVHRCYKGCSKQKNCAQVLLGLGNLECADDTSPMLLQYYSRGYTVGQQFKWAQQSASGRLKNQAGTEPVYK